jgi:DNA-binding NarL/FixJ family response regulator
LTSVVIVDDQDLVRNGLRLILGSEPDIDVVGEATDGKAGRDLVAALDPDVVLMDVQMPGEDGLTATRHLVAEGIRSRILVLTTFDLDQYVYEALSAGASGFLLKDMSGEEICSAVRQAARGAEALLAPAVTRRLVERFAKAGSRSRPHPGLARLTERERDVLRLMAAGLANHEIATRLFIGETTVKTHVARIFTKLDARDRVQAVIIAHESNLVLEWERDEQDRLG